MTHIIGVLTEFCDDEGKVISIISEEGKPLKTFFNWFLFDSWLKNNNYFLKSNYICQQDIV